MRHLLPLRTCFRNLSILLLLAGATSVFAQPARKLAPGVLTTVPPSLKTEETMVGPIGLTNVTRLNWTPTYIPQTETLRSKASNVVLRHNVWCLEFSFKPVRMVEVDIPQTSGKMQRKLIWYLVYRIRNLGGHLTPVGIEDEFGHKTYGTQSVDEVLNIGASQVSASIRFFPHFVLQSDELGKSYLDRYIPIAVAMIQQREMRGGKLYSTQEITQTAIPASSDAEGGGVWGVATWEDVDPRIDYFSIFVQGLTNAFRIVPPAEGGRTHQMKTLQLNFWRPGDAVYEHEKEIRFGVPAVANPGEQADILKKYGLTERLDYLWVYR